jgi:hypothetical protein
MNANCNCELRNENENVRATVRVRRELTGKTRSSFSYAVPPFSQASKCTLVGHGHFGT